MSGRRRRSRSRRPGCFVWAALAAGLTLTLALVVPVRWLDPPTTSFILLAAAEQLAPRQRWVALEAIAPALAIAVVAAEDQKFPVHAGFDLQSIRGALAESGNRPRGASTISQQVAKNLYLWPGRSWVRKGLEAWLTGWLEVLWPKRRILEVYLNVAEFGPGVFGAEVAAREFFGKPAAALSEREAALLAAVLPNPKDLSAAHPSPWVLERAAWIEAQARQLGGPAYLGW